MCIDGDDLGMSSSPRVPKKTAKNKELGVRCVRVIACIHVRETADKKTCVRELDSQKYFAKIHTSILTEFEVRTLSYGPSFFPLGFMDRALRAWTINPGGKKLGP